MSKTKQNALVLIVLAALLVAVLAMSLPDLVLLPGQPFSLSTPQPIIAGVHGGFPGGEALFNIFRGLLAVALVLLPVYIIYSLFSPEGRRRLIVHVVLFILLFLLADYLQKNPPDFGSGQQMQPPALDQNQADSGGSFPIAVFSPHPPQWLTLVIVLAGSLIAAAFIVSLSAVVRRRAQPASPFLEQLAEEAQGAIVSLHSGGDFKATVIHCYREMSRVLKQERGIARETAMTPREFEALLVEKGLPQEPVRTLTRLFEHVRYGHVTANAQETDLAVACLTDIVAACQTLRAGHE